MRRPLVALVVLLATPGAATAATGPALRVDAGAARHRIDPDVYGMNSAKPALARQIDLPVDRWGGNLFEMYNFTLGAVNTGNDYFFEDIADCFSFDTGCEGGNEPAYRRFVRRNRARGTKPLMALPMAGYVAKDAPTDHPFTCGFPPSAGGRQSFDRYDAGCGDGAGDAAADPTRDGAPITAADRRTWIRDLARRGAHLFELGNEPALWNSTHRDIHPDATTYDELWAKSAQLAEAVKANDPKGKVIGFSEWGWPNYFCSAADDTETGCYAGNPSNPDRAAHGDVPLVNWLLRRFRARSAARHERLLDYIDVHYYPQGRDGANRMDVTRSLWDPSYTDPSYVDTAIELLPRMRRWVAADYPGTKTALTEYDLLDPALSDRRNVLVQADTLGIFGREGLDLATYFDERVAPVAAAFRIFRNYDGRHHRFGATSVRAVSGDASRLSLYAAQRADGTLTVLVINKTKDAQRARLEVAHVRSRRRAQAFRWAGGDAIRPAGRRRLAGVRRFPPESLTLLVAPHNGAKRRTSRTVTPRKSLARVRPSGR